MPPPPRPQFHDESPTQTSGSDRFGAFQGAELKCVLAGRTATTPAVFSWRAYACRAGGEGKLVATLSLPEGANDTAAQGAFDIHQTVRARPGRLSALGVP